MIRFAVCWLMLSGLVLGQAEAKIDAPARAMPGELVVLSSTGSKGDALKWITPEGISTAQAGCTAIESQIFFATPRTGSYTFILVVADKTASIDYAKHTVVIGDPVAPQPPPEQPSEFGKLTDLSRTNSLKLNDSATRALLSAAIKNTVTALKAQCGSGACPGFPQASSAVISAIEAVLLARPRGPSRDANWDEVWRRPNAAWINANKIDTVPKYLDACLSIAKGLE